VGFKEETKHFLNVNEFVRCSDIWTNSKYVSFSLGALTNKVLVEEQLLYNISLSTPTGAFCLTDVYKKDMLQAFLHKFTVFY